MSIRIQKCVLNALLCCLLLSVMITNSHAFGLEGASPIKLAQSIKDSIDNPDSSPNSLLSNELSDVLYNLTRALQPSLHFSHNHEKILAQYNEQIFSTQQSVQSTTSDIHSFLTTDSTEHTILQDSSTLFAGTCRNFGEGTTGLLDKASICKYIIPEGSSILDPSMLAYVGGQYGVGKQLFTITAAADPRTDCDLAVVTYICNLLYAPCTTVTTTDGKTTGVGQFPCRVGYKENLLEPHCPDLAAYGIFDGFIPGLPLSIPMPWGDEGSCHDGLEIVSRTTVIQGPSGAIQVDTIPPVTCNAPLVTVDPSTYKYTTIMNGYCALPCPSIQFSQADIVWRDKFAMGWQIFSNFVGCFVVISYWVLPVLRQRTYITLAMTFTMIHAVWFFIPWAHLVNEHGYGGGHNILCRGPAEEQLGQNFNCTITGWLSMYSLFGTALSINFLGLSLIEKMCFPNFMNSLTPKQKKIKEWISVGICFLIPTICNIIVSAYGEFTGNSAAMLYCYLSRDRTGEGPDLAFSIGFIVPGVIVGISYLELLWIVVYIGYVQFKSRSTNTSKLALTVAQIRIVFAIIVISTLGLAALLFRSYVDRNEAKMTKSAEDFVLCLLTSPGGMATCGTKPEHAFPDGWANFLLWSIATRGLTLIIGIAGSLDIFYGWAAFYYYYFGIKWLKPYAKDGGLELYTGAHHFEPESKSGVSQSGTIGSGASQTSVMSSSETNLSPHSQAYNAKAKMFGGKRRPIVAASSAPVPAPQPEYTGLASPVSDRDSSGGQTSPTDLRLPSSPIPELELQNIPSSNCALEDAPLDDSSQSCDDRSPHYDGNIPAQQ